MSTASIVVVAIWNTLLIGALAATIHWRERLLQWIIGCDSPCRDLWELSDDSRWAAFLAEHRELIDR